MKRLCSVLLLLLCGCARFSSEQVQVKLDGTRVTSHQRITTFFAGNATVGKLRASTTDKTQGLTVGSISTETEGGTNLVPIVEALARGVISGLK